MKSSSREIAWLLGWYILTVLLLGGLAGFHHLLDARPLDIQLHNTYFVVARWHLTIPLFLLVATLGTSARVVLGYFSRRVTKAVLVALGVVWLPPIVVGLFLAWLVAWGEGPRPLPHP